MMIIDYDKIDYNEETIPGEYTVKHSSNELSSHHDYYGDRMSKRDTTTSFSKDGDYFGFDMSQSAADSVFYDNVNLKNDKVLVKK